MAAEINACIEFLDMAVKFLASVPRRWYESSSELDLFPSRVDCLRAKFTTYTTSVRKAKLRNAKTLSRLAEEGTAILNNETKHLKKVQQSRLSLWKYKLYHRAFPGQLVIILNNIEYFLNAGIDLLQFNVDTSNLVEKSMTSPLPFGQDSKYVPIIHSIDEVHKALENENGCRVVIVCGEPGSGKTSLAKYVALQYQPHQIAQGPGEPSSSAVFPDGVFFLRCGLGAERKIKQLQRSLLHSLGCESEAVPVYIPEERDGDYVSIPTFRRRLQFRLKDLKALIILDDVWERPVLEELILSTDEAGHVKYLLTSQFRDIWRDGLNIKIKRPTFQEARQILLKYTNGLSADKDFPVNIRDTAASIIEQLHFHPLSLANVGLGFRQEEGQEVEAWRAVKDAWEHEPPIREFYKPLIYGVGYPFALDITMTRVVRSLEGSTLDLLFLLCALNNAAVPETAVKYLYKCAKIGNMSGYKFAINHLQNSSLVDVYSYHAGRTELVIHKLRALSVISQFPHEVGVLTRRALEPVREMYDNLRAQTTLVGGLLRRALQPVWELYIHDSAQTALIPARYCDSVDVHDGLLNASMVGMYMNQRFVGDAKIEIPRGVDLDVEDLLKTAGEKEFSLREMVQLTHSHPSGEAWRREAGMCAKKIIVRFACRHELDDESVGRLIRLHETRDRVLFFLEIIFLFEYWWASYFQQNKTFSSAHPQIAKNLSDLIHDDGMSNVTLCNLVKFLFGNYRVYGMLDFEDDDTIVNFGERLVRLALRGDGNISSECLPVQKFPSSDTRAFRVIEKKVPDVWKAVLTLFVQRYVPCMWFSSQVLSEDDIDMGVLEMLSENVDFRLHRRDAFAILEWVSSRAENRAQVLASPKIMASVIGVLVQADETQDPMKSSVFTAACVLRNLALSKHIRQEILSTYPLVVETLERLEQKCTREQPNGFEPQVLGISEAIGLLHSNANAVQIQISYYSPSISKWRFERIVKARIQGYFEKKMYKEFLTVMEGNLIPRDVKQEFLIEIIVAKTMLKRYHSALADAHANVLEKQQRWSKSTAEALGLQGTVKLLSGENLPDALVDFEEAVHILLSLETPSGSRHYSNTYHNLIYHMWKQRGFTKHLLGDDAGARKDAIEAQRLQLCNLVWDVSSTDDLYRVWNDRRPELLLFRRPLTYSGFNFTF